MGIASRVNGYAISHETLEEMRWLAVRMVWQGIRVVDIATGMRLHSSTIFGWWRKYRRGGNGALKSTKAPGARPKLKQSQVLKLIEMLRRPAQDYGFDSDLWTGPRVRVLIKEKFGVRFHAKHMPRFLTRLGLVRKSPERRALEQDPREVRHLKQRVLPRLTRQAAQCRGLILYGDEALFSLIPHVGKTWTFPDLKPVARVSGKRGVHVGVTSAVSPQGHLVFQFSKGNFNSATLMEFMKLLHQHFRNRRLFFIIDGAPCHKAKAVSQFVQKNSSWLSLSYLPSYSPELNPDEEVWNFAKTRRLNAVPLRDKKELHAKVAAILRSLKKSPDKIKTFFEK